MYAIIATGGKQYKVCAGDMVYVEKLGVEPGSTYRFDQVLAVGGESLTVGNPTVEGAEVTASVIGDVKGKKVIVYKYKRKSGYHKKNGHRQQYTQVKIEKIAYGDLVEEAAAAVETLETAAEETAAEEAVVEETVVEEAAVEETVAEETVAGETAVEEAAAEEDSAPEE